MEKMTSQPETEDVDEDKIQQIGTEMEQIFKTSQKEKEDVHNKNLFEIETKTDHKEKTFQIETGTADEHKIRNKMMILQQETETFDKDTTSKPETKTVDKDKIVKSEIKNVHADKTSKPEIKIVNQEKNIRIVLLGTTGNGRTATAKSIMIGKKVNSKSAGGWHPITEEIIKTQTTFKGHRISILDTPGIHRNKDEDATTATKKIIDLIFSENFFLYGVDAVVLVLSYHKRFNKEEIETIQILKSILGENWLKSHGIILFTAGDSFRRDLGEKSEFDKWCQEQTGHVKVIIDECNNRCVLFDNYHQNEEQVQELLTCINKLRTRNDMITLKPETQTLYDDKTSKQEKIFVDKEKEIQIMLLGTTGNGRTATVKSIMMGENITSKSVGGWNAITDKIIKTQTIFKGHRISILDTPGIHRNKDEDPTTATKKIIDLIFSENFFVDGVDAVVLVLSYHKRFNKEEIESIQILKSILGENWLKSHGIILFTAGDSFRRDFGDKYEFEKWCQEQTGHLKVFIDECSNRCVLFDNYQQNGEQIQELLTCINKIRTINNMMTLKPEAKTVYKDNTPQSLLSYFKKFFW